MIHLANGCRCSDLKIHPSNWNDPGADIHTEWYLHYRFYSSECPQGKQIKIRGMNGYKTLADRRAYAKELIESEKELLTQRNYNPITGYILEENGLFQSFDDAFGNSNIKPDDPYIPSLYKALELCENTKKIKDNIKSVLKYYGKACKAMNVYDAPLNAIEKRHVKVLLDKCGSIKANWSNHSYNTYKAYLSILYNHLEDERIIADNFVRTIRKKEHVVAKRIMPTDDQRAIIDKHLKENHYHFWVVFNMFYHSGSRRTEFMALKTEDVIYDLQDIWYTIKKGKTRRACRPMKDVTKPLWEMILQKAQPGQYLFSYGLMPGPVMVGEEMLTRYWKEYVKDELGIDLDLYTAKAMNSTETKNALGATLAAKMNQHSEEVLNKHYDLEKERRDREERERDFALLRKVNNSFVPVK